MSNSSVIPTKKQNENSRAEVYGRGSGGRLTARLGFLEEFLGKKTEISIINYNVDVDFTEISRKITQIPLEIKKRDLQAKFRSITDKFNNIQTHKSEFEYSNLHNICESCVNDFYVYIEEEIKSIKPSEYDQEEKLKSFLDICESFYLILTIYLYSSIKLYEKSVHNERPIIQHIENTYNLLKNYIQKALFSTHFIQNSLMYSILMRGSDEEMNEILEYDGRYFSIGGVRVILRKAIEEGNRDREQINLERQKYYVKSIIEIMRLFETLYEKRISLKPSLEVDQEENSHCK